MSIQKRYHKKRAYNCDNCGKETMIEEHRFKTPRGLLQEHFYCGLSCAHKARVGRTYGRCSMEKKALRQGMFRQKWAQNLEEIKGEMESWKDVPYISKSNK